MIPPACGSLRVWVVVLALLAMVRPAAAQIPVPDTAGQIPAPDQEPLPEPTGPIGPATADSQRPGVTPTVQTQRLDLAFSFYGALDQTSVTDVRHVFSSEPLLNDRVGYGGGTANLTYTYAGKDNTFAAVGGSGLRNYTATTTSVFYPSDVYGGLTFSRRLSRRVRLTGREIVTFTPYYTFGGSQSSGAFTDLVPSLSATPQLTSPGVAPQFDQAVNRVDAINNDTTVGVTWTLNRKSSFTLGYSYYHTDASASYRVNNMGANGSYQYQKSRYLSLHVGYGFYRNQLPELIQLPGPIVDHYDSHNIDVGVGYRRPLSFSRRSIISFNVGSTVITDGVKPYFYITGDGSLSHQLSQFWTLALSYNRGVSRSGGLAAPFVSDVGALSVGGLLTRHLSLAGIGSFSRGNTAVGTSNAYDAAYTTGRLTYELTRFLPIYTEYMYYFYRFNTSNGLAVNFPMNVNRNGVRLGLAYSIPLIGRRPQRR